MGLLNRQSLRRPWEGRPFPDPEEPTEEEKSRRGGQEKRGGEGEVRDPFCPLLLFLFFTFPEATGFSSYRGTIFKENKQNVDSETAIERLSNARKRAKYEGEGNQTNTKRPLTNTKRNTKQNKHEHGHGHGHGPGTKQNRQPKNDQKKQHTEKPKQREERSS